MRKEGDHMYIMHIKIHAQWRIHRVEGRLDEDPAMYMLFNVQSKTA